MEILPEREIAEIRSKYPDISQEYLAWLSEVGWGELESGYMIYSSPIYASEMFGELCPENIKKVLMVGDDMAGYSVGFVFNDSGWNFVGVDSCGWVDEMIPEGFSAYFKVNKAQ
ncbi:hypothetical protein KFE80_00320 [bacterium SCSIO 12696]|nr:hypothetical protein KFE80_00320 [bacterium SCSIO 12696]